MTVLMANLILVIYESPKKSPAVHTFSMVIVFHILGNNIIIMCVLQLFDCYYTCLLFACFFVYLCV